MNKQPKQTQTLNVSKMSKKAKGGSRKSNRRNPLEKSTISATQSVATAYSNKRVTGKPNQYHLPNGDAVIEHTEFIQDLAGSTGFTTVQVPVNPGLPGSFPWLSSIAANYESYKFEKLEYEYQNSCGSTTTGVVMLGVDYDASDPAPVDKIQFASYQDYARDAPWKIFTQRNRRPNLSKRESYYVRTGSLLANQDIKLYDTGNLFVATQGMADASNVGELYVKYKVRLYTPQIQNVAVGSSKSSKMNTTTTAATIQAGSNAPLSITGNTSSYTVTARSAYDALVTIVTNGGVNQTADLTGTATVSNSGIGLSPSTQTAVRVCEVQFLPGQTLIVTSTGTTPNTSTISFGQFNVSVL